MINFALFLEGLEALAQLIPAIGSFVTIVHPANGQEAQRVATATNVANAALQLAGTTGAVLQALQPAVTSAAHAAAGVQAPTVAAPTTADLMAANEGAPVIVMSNLTPLQQTVGKAVAQAAANGTTLQNGDIPGVIIPAPGAITIGAPTHDTNGQPLSAG